MNLRSFFTSEKKKRARIVHLNSLVKKGFAKEIDDLPIWEIPIKWNSPAYAQRKGWSISWIAKRAFLLSTGYRLVYFAAEDSDGKKLMRLYTIDKMGKRGYKRFSVIISAIEFAGIDYPKN